MSIFYWMINKITTKTKSYFCWTISIIFLWDHAE